jgi:hypothetical protein
VRPPFETETISLVFNRLVNVKEKIEIATDPANAAGHLPGQKRPGSDKRAKDASFVTPTEVRILFPDRPSGAVSNGYEEYLVQELVLGQSHALLAGAYHLARRGISREPHPTTGGRSAQFAVLLVQFRLSGGEFAANGTACASCWPASEADPPTGGGSTR